MSLRALDTHELEVVNTLIRDIDTHIANTAVFESTEAMRDLRAARGWLRSIQSTGLISADVRSASDEERPAT